MRFSEELRAQTDSIWEPMFRHPFLSGLGDGSLAPERFEFYIRQDYLYLMDYARVRGLAIAKASQVPHMSRLAELLSGLLNGEMMLHRRLARAMHLTEADLLATEMAPTNHAYTRHLLTVGYSGSLGEILAAIFPCAGGYREIGALLGAAPPPANDLYAAWIADYSGPVFRGIIDWIEVVWNELAEVAGPAERARMAEHYRLSARYEYLFWEMAWTRESWSI